MANLVVHSNTDTQDLPLNSSGVEWTDLDLNNDTLIFTAGSNVVKDGEPLPSQSDLVQAGVVLTGAQIVVDKYLLSDASSATLKEISLMGNNTNRYVMAFDFDNLTASEPVLELWDDTLLNTVANITLGAGVPNNSWWRGVVTTDGAPSAGWALTGSRLAGASSGNFLLLNNGNGALPSATTLYANLAIVIPASASTGGSVVPVFVVKWLSN